MIGSKAIGLVLALMALMVMGCPDGKDIIQEVVKPPTIQVKDVSVSGISLEKLDLMVDLEITNPNPIGLTVNKVEYDLAMGGKSVLAGKTEPKVQIKASGVTPAKVPLSVTFSEVVNIFTAALGQGNVKYKLTGKVYVGSPIGDIPIPFEDEGELPVFDPSQL